MKKLLTLCLVLFYCLGYSQKVIEPTEKFTITGEVKEELVVTKEDLTKFPTQKIKKLDITSHNGEVRNTFKKLRGIPIIEILKSVQVATDNPRIYSEHYLIFKASDGYSIVYSWNELFNASTGRETFVLTYKDGEELAQMPERIAILTPKDIRTGRRYIKALDEIIVKRIN